MRTRHIPNFVPCVICGIKMDRANLDLNDVCAGCCLTGSDFPMPVEPVQLNLTKPEIEVVPVPEVIANEST